MEVFLFILGLFLGFGTGDYLGYENCKEKSRYAAEYCYPYRNTIDYGRCMDYYLTRNKDE